MNLKLWNKLTTNQQRTIIRRNKISLLEITNVNICYPVVKTISTKETIKAYRGGYR